MGSSIDLRKYQDSSSIEDAFSMLVSGKPGYKAVIERKKEVPKCPKCSHILSGEEKFCSECGQKLN